MCMAKPVPDTHTNTIYVYINSIQYELTASKGDDATYFGCDMLCGPTTDIVRVPQIVRPADGCLS